MLSDPLSSPQAQPKKPIQSGFAITAFPRWDARLGAGPTREIGRLGGPSNLRMKLSVIFKMKDEKVVSHSLTNVPASQSK